MRYVKLCWAFLTSLIPVSIDPEEVARAFVMSDLEQL